MKIYRYTGRPATLKGSYQHKVVTMLNVPYDYDEFNDHEEIMRYPSKWYFGFTKEQLLKANRNAKRDSENSYYFEWDESSRLVSLEVPDEKVLELYDQVVFHRDYASIPFEQFK